LENLPSIELPSDLSYSNTFISLW